MSISTPVLPRVSTPACSRAAWHRVALLYAAGACLATAVLFGVVGAAPVGDTLSPTLAVGGVLAAGEPVERAEVFWLDPRADAPEAEPRAVSDRDGRFEIALPVGFGSLLVRADGYATSRFDLDPADSSRARLDLPPLELIPTRALTVRVRDGHDEPHAARVGWPVAAGHRALDRRARAWRLESVRTTTDASGMARLAVGREGAIRVVSRRAAQRWAPSDHPVPSDGMLTIHLSAGRATPIRALDDDGQAVAGARVVDPVSGAELAVLDAEGRAIVQAAGRLDLVVVGERGERGLGVVDPALSPLPTWTVWPARLVSGTVSSAPTGDSLARAMVWARAVDGTPAWTSSALDGAFGLRVAAPRPLVGAVAPGYEADWAQHSAAAVNLALTPHRVGIGQVVDAHDQPVADAQILLGDRRARSQADGTFSVVNPAVGHHDLVVEAPGARRARVPGVEVPAARGEIDLGVITMLDGAELSGWVVEADGAAVTEATVMVLPESGNPAIDPPLGASPVDASGAFSVDGLKPGGVSVHVTSPGYLPIRTTAVAPSSDLEIVLDQAAQISGSVLDSAGGAVADALVTLEPLDAGSEATPRLALHAVTDSDGRFTLDGAGFGTAMLSVSAADHGPARQQIEIHSVNTGPVDVVLPAGGRILGSLRDRQGQPVVGSVSLSPATVAGQVDVAAMAFSDAQGRFELRGLLPGRHSMVAEASDGRRLVRDIQVDPGDQQLDLMLEETGVEVVGQVLNDAGEGIAEARVSLHDLAGGRSGPETRTDAFGQFSFAAVPAGDYGLRAEHPAYAAGRELHRLQVADREPSGVTIVLGRGAAVYGRVSGVDFDDLDRVIVRALGLPGGVGVDFAGRFSLGPLPEGDVVLEAVVRGTGRVTRERVLVDPSAAGTEVELRLR